MTTRRRNVRPAPDDPRLPRRMRKDSGVNLMHEDDWYGFNVASKMPTRNDVDPAGIPFLGLPGGILRANAISNAELGPNSVLNGNIGEQINATKLPNIGGLNGMLDGGRIARKSIPSDAIHNLHGSKIVGKESVPWANIKVSGVVFGDRLEATVRDLKRFMAKHYQKKP